jgi:sRNA-binding carbon storage regulator CsrA
LLVLILDSEDNSIKIGDDITLYFSPGSKRDEGFYKKIRVAIDAPKSLAISRPMSESKKKKEF